MRIFLCFKSKNISLQSKSSQTDTWWLNLRRDLTELTHLLDALEERALERKANLDELKRKTRLSLSARASPQRVNRNSPIVVESQKKSQNNIFENNNSDEEVSLKPKVSISSTHSKTIENEPQKPNQIHFQNDFTSLSTISKDSNSQKIENNPIQFPFQSINSNSSFTHNSILSNDNNVTFRTGKHVSLFLG